MIESTESNKRTVLYLTDLYFEAKGRSYFQEDLYLTARLRDEFEIIICHPCDSEKFEKLTDIIVFRNTGPVMNYEDYFRHFVNRVKTNGIISYNSMDGKADMKGKEYLLTLTLEGYPTIPTIEQIEDLTRLPLVEKYIVKPKNGADSIGMRIVNHTLLSAENLTGSIIQPFIDFDYEVSFYFIDQDFQYSLYAPDKAQRWDLQLYQPSEADLSFAIQFVKWNSLSHGIQRVDACRLRDGSLLLVELEDLNPYLSIELLPDELKENFVSNFKNSIDRAITNKF